MSAAGSASPSLLAASNSTSVRCMEARKVTILAPGRMYALAPLMLRSPVPRASLVKLAAPGLALVAFVAFGAFGAACSRKSNDEDPADAAAPASALDAGAIT